MAFRAEIDDFGAFYEATYPAAFRTAFGIVGDRTRADDIAQDAYVLAYRDRARFRGDAPARAWLLRIVVNRAISSVRGPRPTVVTLDVAEAPDPADPNDAPARIAASLSMEEALRHLAPRDRAAVVLRYYHDLDYAAIGEILGLSATNVGVILHRSLERLRRTLGAREPVESVEIGREASHG
jgi:RNA polymerase sigma-70 factor (ECF subfamily)